MSMKFFAGLQDFLGLHDTSSSNNEQQQQQEQQLVSSASTTATTPPAVVVGAATTSSLLSSPSVLSANLNSIESERNSVKYISDISNNCTVVQKEQQQLQKITLDDSKEITDAEEKIQHCSHRRNVHFPDVIVTDFYDAPTNVFTNKNANDTSAISLSYLNACRRLRIDPIQTVQEQIACFHQVVGVRQECLSLKGHRLSSADMECLEEIFNKVQFDMLDFEYTFLDDDSAVCLGEMLEFYDSAVKLNLSFNKQINLRGWQAICKAVRDAPSMQYLNLRYTSLSDRAVPVLARALRSQSSLTILHLENVSLSGRNLILVGCALKGNTMLRELYLGENNLQPADGAHIYQIIITSVSIQLLDLRNNQLQDGGLRHICDALRHRETTKSSSLSALVLWNNRLTSSGMEALAQALIENSKLETLNIGNNSLLLEGIVKLKPALQKNCSLQRLGLQATNLDCQSAIVLAECLADNKVMIRLDLRDNPHIGSAGLLALHLAMKMNTSLTVLNLDISVAQSSSLKVKEYQEQFEVYYDEIKMFCERNKEIALKKLSVLTTVEDVVAATDVTHSEENTEMKKDEEKEDEEEKQKTKMTRNGQINNLEVAQRKIATTSKSPIWLLGRSSSLTCTETVHDISERVAQMTHHSLALIEKIPDSITTIKKQSDESHPALFTKSELSKCPSLPSIAPGDYLEAGVNTPVKKISRRFTVSTSSLNETNPRDVARIKSRFKVEQVGPSIQKTAKAKSDDCISLQRSLSESSGVDRREPEFLSREDATLEVENFIAEKSKESESSGFSSIDELSGSFEFRNGEKSIKCTLSEDVQGKDESCDTRNAINSHEEITAQKHESDEDLQSNSVQFTAVVTLQRGPDTPPIQDYFGDATFVVKFTDNIALKLDVEKCSNYEQAISVNHPTEQLQHKEKNYEKNVTMQSETSLSSCSVVEDDSTDTSVVKEVVRDVINYVVYEISDDDSFYYRKISFGTTSGSNESSPSVHSSSAISRSSSSFTLNPSHDAETDDDVIRNVVRGLVRDILLQEKELLRRSLRKKRRHLITMPKMDHRSSS
ncbi:Leucine Rich Repeat family protein [Brugia malayi]|uniref:Leucine Rich Repeat family protein n=1 Tax=Brugia malayi TaxID=6279 RepID=A0A4E9FQ49_BRUMA|nr:Leucine Rich Repeat family protein [Brugia malayi]VIO99218.1 Leucine Rich Repeat family protein [Brugia malayi]